MKKAQVSLIQMNVNFGEKEKNLKKAESLIEKALYQANQSIPHLACLPELFSTGYDLKNVHKHAERIPNDKTTKILQSVAAKFSTGIMTSLMEKTDNKYYNTAIFINEKGEFQGKYRKIHLFPLDPMDERPVFSTGGFEHSRTFFETSFGKVGLLICFDLRFPELSRRIVLEGAEFLVYLAEFPKPRSEIWKRLLQARAMENQIFVCGVNRVGTDPTETSFFGKSLVYDPNGNLLAEGSDKEEVLTIYINPEIVKKAKSILDSFEHRKPSFY
jgi:predicted amidohydrolase